MIRVKLREIRICIFWSNLCSLIIIIIMAGMAVFLRGWPPHRGKAQMACNYCFPTRTMFKINSEFWRKGMFRWENLTSHLVRMKNSSYYIAPVGDWTHDLPHTVASNMVKVSHALNLLGTKFLGNCMCYHGRVIIEGCRTKCVIDKYRNIFIFWSGIDIPLWWHMHDYCMNSTKIIKK